MPYDPKFKQINIQLNLYCKHFLNLNLPSAHLIVHYTHPWTFCHTCTNLLLWSTVVINTSNCSVQNIADKNVRPIRSRGRPQVLLPAKRMDVVSNLITYRCNAALLMPQISTVLGILRSILLMTAWKYCCELILMELEIIMQGTYLSAIKVTK